MLAHPRGRTRRKLGGKSIDRVALIGGLLGGRLLLLVLHGLAALLDHVGFRRQITHAVGDLSHHGIVALRHGIRVLSAQHLPLVVHHVQRAIQHLTLVILDLTGHQMGLRGLLLGTALSLNASLTLTLKAQLQFLDAVFGRYLGLLFPGICLLVFKNDLGLRNGSNIVLQDNLDIAFFLISHETLLRKSDRDARLCRRCGHLQADGN